MLQDGFDGGDDMFDQVRWVLHMVGLGLPGVDDDLCGVDHLHPGTMLVGFIEGLDGWMDRWMWV